jgi:translation initiation factor IF-3
MAPPEKSGPRANEDITARQVRLIGADGSQVGVVTIEAAMRAALDAGLDLVEISPNADPPVCKVLDVGKFKYEAQKKANEARKRQKTFDVKEIKMRPNIDDHDYETKMKALRKFVDEGDKVKLTVRFRGRELAHPEIGSRLLERIRTETEEDAKVESYPKMEGRQMIMVIAPR